MGLFDRLFRRTAKPPVNPSAPHTFVSIDDAGYGAAVARSAGARGGQPLGMNAALAGTFIQQQRCGVPGCGRDRDDPIHFPEG